MIKELNLSGTDLMVYAIIYGFTQDGNLWFGGSLQYLMDWTGSTKQTVISSLKRLVEDGLLEKVETFNGAIKNCKYRTKRARNSISEEPTATAEEVKPITDIDSSGTQAIVDHWNRQNNVVKVMSLRPFTRRYDNTKLCLRFTDLNGFIQTIDKIDSMKRFKQWQEKGYTLTYDWFSDPDNFVKIMEGQYREELKFNNDNKIDWENV